MNSRRGRPAGGGSSREAILRAANEQFLLHGYAQTSAREIARIAGVDHAMVNYYFGSKRNLFTASMSMSVSPRAVLDVVIETTGTHAPPHEFARALATTFLHLWDQEEFREPMLALLRQAPNDEDVRAALAEYMSSELIGRLSEVIGGADTRTRPGAMATFLVGTLMSRYVFRLEPVASMSQKQLSDVMSSMLVVPLRGTRRG